MKNFFFKKIILIITILEKKITIQLKKYFKKLFQILTKNIKIIFKFSQLKYSKNYKKIFKKYFLNNFLIIYDKKENLRNQENWINIKIKKISQFIDTKLSNFLLTQNTLNILEIFITLNNLFIIYPKKKITFEKFKKYQKKNNKFELYHWIYSIILGKKQHSIFILKNLKKYNIPLKNIIQCFKNFIITILKIKNKEITLLNYSQFFIFNTHINFKKIYDFSIKNNIQKIYSSIKLLKIIDYYITINKISNIWIYLQILSITLY
ncbi:hypothetical protein [Buchnera aphidicola]|uniref:hypothetical protein n=1 Tax=Buchnera aphidicola TaxID=9 RepID=UPI0031B864EB